MIIPCGWLLRWTRSWSLTKPCRFGLTWPGRGWFGESEARENGKRNRGGSSIFTGEGGGGCKRLCACTHIMNAKPAVPYGHGPGHASRPLHGSSRVLLCSLVLSEPHFNHFDRKWGGGGTVDQILGGGGPVAPSLDPPLRNDIKTEPWESQILNEIEKRWEI